MIIGLTGYAQSGKDTVAEILVRKSGYKRIAFADPIRNVLYDMNPMIDNIAGEPIFLQTLVNRVGWDEAKQNPRVRQYLQNLGVSARTHIDSDVWVIRAVREMNSDEDIVITDVRFENEARLIKAAGGQIWRITRPGVAPVNGHVSESEMANYRTDREIINSGSIEDLEVIIQTRMLANV
jgi:hypothetical protein